ncbi:MAG: hypothetical protein ACI353_00670 [Alloprevotella sp.]
MSLSKFESDTKYIAKPVSEVYERFADLCNLRSLQEKLDDPTLAERLPEGVSADKIEEARRQLSQMTFEADSVSIPSPVGAIKLCIVEREENKLLKFAGEGTPIPLYLWIQMLPQGDDATKMRVTIGAEVNIFMKGMVSKPLQQAAEGLASILAAV